jgi:hypothetical protein
MASINTIFKIISKALDASRTPPPEIPALLLLTGAKLRPGLSPIMIASKIITRQAEAGAPVGVLPSGGANISEIMEMIRVEEIISALQTDARIDVAIAPGITLTAQGANGGGPVVCLGQTIGIGSGNGIIR